ncbi:hypothetical protein K493DRAFT_67154 [Basidiobolus meristosporus CBS 931.73]|uniref:Uncharacterized protein n=1 Tax=Basidiobolus meristosporus CBS 931.73 TaxID=1314790 RepID=A0A1Y1XUZ6_9FUNG|nr:hypothetical protein K493DRAFT_67154 [Basidiobolus meristosporus CBS 931.73]|eukprot:ORX89578.1 hypothetical protein K493DRAFT_67154 [Basidiobolus meristosporus CBS 931.73]
MCFPATCNTCGKTTWKGCGRHIDSVMKNVPVEQRCTCPREQPAGGKSFLSSIFALCC